MRPLSQIIDELEHSNNYNYDLSLAQQLDNLITELREWEPDVAVPQTWEWKNK